MHQDSFISLTTTIISTVCEYPYGSVSDRPRNSLYRSLASSVPDPSHFGTDPDLAQDPGPAPDPAFFVSDLKDAKKNLNFFF